MMERLTLGRVHAITPWRPHTMSPGYGLCSALLPRPICTRRGLRRGIRIAADGELGGEEGPRYRQFCRSHRVRDLQIFPPPPPMLPNIAPSMSSMSYSEKIFRPDRIFRTIEHLNRPAWVEHFAKLRHDRTILVISWTKGYHCDPNPGEQNPFHARKYKLDEFLSLTKDHLGTPAGVL